MPPPQHMTEHPRFAEPMINNARPKNPGRALLSQTESRQMARRLQELKIYERIVNRMSDVGVANLATRAAKPPWLP